MKTEAKIDDGKYTIVHENGTRLHVLRNGEAWLELCAIPQPKLMIAIADEIESLRKLIDAAKAIHPAWLAPVAAAIANEIEPLQELIDVAKAAHPAWLALVAAELGVPNLTEDEALQAGYAPLPTQPTDSRNLERAINCGAFIPKGPPPRQRIAFTFEQLDNYTANTIAEQARQIQELKMTDREKYLRDIAASTSARKIDRSKARHAVLDQAFKVLTEGQHWKSPINVVMSFHELDSVGVGVYLAAIEYFTSTKAMMFLLETEHDEQGKQINTFRIVSEGYSLSDAG